MLRLPWDQKAFSHAFSQFSRVVSDSSRPHWLQQARPPCPSPTPGACSNSCQSSRWCHPTISSSVVPFSWLQSYPAPGSFLMSQFFTSGGQSIGASASASVISMNTQDGLTGWISLKSKGLSWVFSNTTVQKHQFFSAQLSLGSSCHIHTWPLDRVFIEYLQSEKNSAGHYRSYQDALQSPQLLHLYSPNSSSSSHALIVHRFCLVYVFFALVLSWKVSSGGAFLNYDIGHLSSSWISALKNCHFLRALPLLWIVFCIVIKHYLNCRCQLCCDRTVYSADYSVDERSTEAGKGSLSVSPRET